MKTADFLLDRPLDPKNLLADIRARLCGYTLDRLSELTEADRTTLHDMISEPREAVVLCRMLERLGSREGFTGRYLRHLPRFTHTALSHNPLLVSRLAAICRKNKGTTIIQSENETARTFLAYALGHEIEALATKKNKSIAFSACGGDIFVPFSTVFLLQSMLSQEQQSPTINKAILMMRSVGTPVITIGLSPSFPKLIVQLLSRAVERHIIICEDCKTAEKLCAQAINPVHVLTVMPRSSRSLDVQLRILRK